MPLDRSKARARVDGARTAYRIGIRADFIQLLADDLDAALGEIDGSSVAVGRAQVEADRFKRELDESREMYRKLREKVAHMEAATEVLRSIAASPKGAQKKAEDMLATMGVAVEQTKVGG